MCERKGDMGEKGTGTLIWQLSTSELLLFMGSQVRLRLFKLVWKCFSVFISQVLGVETSRYSELQVAVVFNLLKI